MKKIIQIMLLQRTNEIWNHIQKCAKESFSKLRLIQNIISPGYNIHSNKILNLAS